MSTVSPSLAPDVDVDLDLVQSRLYNKDLAPVPRLAAQMARRQFRRALDFNVGLHPDLHARLVAYRRRHELVAGDPDDFSRQRHRRDSDDSECARRHALRNSVPGVLSRVVWNARREHSRADARVCRVRLVWHSDLDRRQRDLQNSRRLCSVAHRRNRSAHSRHYDRAVRLLPLFLGNQHACRLQGDRLHSVAVEHQSAAAHRAWIAAPVVGLQKRGRVRSDPFAAFRFRSRPTEKWTILCLLRSRAHRHGRLLGDAVAEHSGFFALRAFTTRSGRGPGTGSAIYDGALRFYRRGGDIGDDDYLRTTDLGSGRCADAFQKSRRARDRDARALHRDIGDEQAIR